MAEGELAPTGNPFDDLDPNDRAVTASSPPSGAVQDNVSPVAPADPTPYDDLGDVGPSPSSVSGAFARGAEKSIFPSAASLVGAGAGGAATVGAAALAGTSVGPWGTVAGALAGGIVAGYGGSYLQNLAVSHMPDSWRDKLGLDDRQARLDEAQHGTASFLGGLLPFAVTMNPGRGAVEALPKNATAMQYIMANPVTSRLFGGGLGGVTEAAQEQVMEGHVDWKKTLISTAFGVVFNRPNRIGETITEIGAHPTRSALGTPHPTVAQVGDLKIMGPGVTEEVFQGTHEQAPTAELTAQEHARLERTELGDHPEPDLHAVARQMEPELFSKYDALVQQRDTFQAWHGEEPPHGMAAKHLAATEAEIREMASDVQAAYRRAEETTTVGVESPENQFSSVADMLAAHENGTGNVPRETSPDTISGTESTPNTTGSETPQRTISEQRAYIADDVTQKLIAVGRPAEEAAAAGKLIAARYITRAGRFEGKLGSAEQLYAREGAAIGGPTGRPSIPGQPEVAGTIESTIPTNRTELADYLAKGGKVEATPVELAQSKDVSPISEREFEQTARGKIMIAEGRRPIIRLMKDANASTFVHESGHQFLEELMLDSNHPEAPLGLRDDAQTVRDWLGVKDDIKTRHHEKFARGFEQYMREGVAPSPELAGVFAKFRNWLLNIYQSIKGLGTEISPDIRTVFDRMLEMEPQRTVIAPERASPTLLHDIHEAEANHFQPHEAEPAMDRIVSEYGRHIEEQPAEIRHELEAELLKTQQVQSADDIVSTREGGAGAGRPSEVVGGSSQPEPKPIGGPSGEKYGTVNEGRSSAGAESVGIQRPDPRSKLGDSPGTSLAPGPTHLFGDESPYTDRAGNIRLDTLNTSEDVRRALKDSAAENADFIGDRRGVVTDGQVMDLANDIGMTGAESLVAQHVAGQAFNAEQVVALRKLLRESADNVSAAAKKFAASGNDADILAFAQAKDRLQMVQKTVAGVTAEAGRALRAFRKLPGEQDTKALEQMMKEATGKTLFQLKAEAKLAAAIDTPQNMNKFMQNVDNKSLGGMVLEGWINGLLSGPSTQVANIVSNAVFSIQHFGVEKAVAGLIGNALHAAGRSGTFTRVGEVVAGAKGVAQGFAPATLAAGESFKKGSTGLLPGEEVPASGILSGILHDDMLQRGTLDMKTTVRDIESAIFATSRGVRDAILAGGALLKAGGVEGSPFMSTKYDVQGQIPDFQIKGMNLLPLGSAVRTTGRFLATADTFAASLNYSASINGIAYRMAADEGLTGSAFSQRIAQLRNTPTPEMMEAARSTARSTTFMDKGGGFVRAINSLTGQKINFPGLGETQPLKFVAPFTNVVSRILEQTIINRTPVGFLSRQIQADLLGKNGNIAQDTAAARMLIGSSVLLGFGALAAEGYVTGSGPKDAKENAIWRTVNQPHSVKIGGTWYTVQKLGPMGMLMGMAADLHDIAHVVEEGDLSKAGGLLFHAIVQNTLDQSALQGPADLIKAIETPDQYGQQYINSFLSSFVRSDLNWIAKSRDPYIRQTWGALDAIKAKLPGYSETLHPKIDLWGEPVPQRSQLGGISGVYTQSALADPVNKAMADLGMGKAMVSKKLRNVELTPDQYEYFARTSGRMAKMRLDMMVKSSQWETFPAYMKMKIINETIDGSRRSAEGLVFAKWPSILVQARDDKMTLIKTGKKPIK